MKNTYNISEKYKKYMDINFEYYKIFYYVAKYRNITKAAAALGSSQPNVTRVMKLLEAQLNCRLFIRGTRGISLTKEGEILGSHVEIACRHLLDAQEEIGGQDLMKGGTVEIGATETALHLFLIKALYDFRRDYPAIRIRIHNDTTPEIVRRLLDGRQDLAVITGPYEVPGAALCEKILDFREVLVGGTQYEALCREPFKLEDVKKYPWVSLGRGSATYEMYRNFFIEHKIDFEPDMEVATSDLMLPLIENNFGIGFVPKELAEPLLREGRLVQIETDTFLPARSLQIVSDKGRGRSLAADTLYKFLRGKFST